MEVQNFNARDKWRWFVSEYAIVVFGVITALAAQQSVEWLHRYQTRRQLEEDLREEMRLNDPYLRDDIQVVYSDYERALRQSQAIQSALQTNKVSTLKYERPPKFKFVIPRNSVWQHARESGTLALLPPDEAQAYTVLYHNLDILSDRVGKWLAAMGQQDAIEIRFGHGSGGLADLSQMPVAQVESLSEVLAEEASAARWALVSLGRMAAMQQVVESGSFSQDEMLKAYSDSRNPAHKFMQSDTTAAPEEEKATLEP
jgi:hypothetical protein